MNYSYYYTEIESICKDMISNDIYVRAFKNKPFQGEICKLMSFLKFINETLHPSNKQYLEFEFKLNIIFNIRISYVGVTSIQDKKELENTILFFKNIMKLKDEHNYERIDQFQIKMDELNKKTFPTCLSNQYLENGSSNKYSINFGYIKNNFEILSDKNINAKVVDQIKLDLNKDKYFFYTNENKSLYKYYKYYIIFALILFLLYITSISFLIKLNVWNPINISFLSLSVIFFIIELIAIINIIKKMKNKNYRHLIPFLIFLYMPSSFKIEESNWFLKISIKHILYYYFLICQVVIIIFTFGNYIQADIYIISYMSISIMTCIFNIICIFSSSIFNYKKPDINYELLIELYDKYYCTFWNKTYKTN